MGTRAVIVVSGAAEHSWDGDGVVRLYRHWDGDPEGVLPDIAEATDETEKYLTRFNNDIPNERQFSQLPAMGFADRIIAAGIAWYGSCYRIDTRFQDNAPAVFNGSLSLKHYGEQGDLEWVYLVDVKGRKLAVWGSGYGTPEEHLVAGPVDPRSSALRLRKEEHYQGRAFLAVTTSMNRLCRQGWTITPPKSRARKWVETLTRRAVAYLKSCLKDEWRTSDVLAMLAGMAQSKSLVTAPYLADAVQDAGCDDRSLLDTLRMAV